MRTNGVTRFGGSPVETGVASGCCVRNTPHTILGAVGHGPLKGCRMRAAPTTCSHGHLASRWLPTGVLRLRDAEESSISDKTYLFGGYVSPNNFPPLEN